MSLKRALVWLVSLFPYLTDQKLHEPQTIACSRRRSAVYLTDQKLHEPQTQFNISSVDLSI